MNIKTITYISLLSLFYTNCAISNKKSKENNLFQKSIAFYNLENLFDTINNPDIRDDERTPQGKYQWNSKKYIKKINNIAKIISKIGYYETGESPIIIGVVEIENAQVMEDLIHQNSLSENYDFIHSDSPDKRGIDVGLLYKKESFFPNNFQNHTLWINNEKGYRIYTRNQLVVSGYLQNEEIFCIINHWPSRRGGQEKSEANRIKAAYLNLKIIDSIRTINPNAKIISMGDFNDDPYDKSINLLTQKTDSFTPLINPMIDLSNKGYGSLAFRDRWFLFDQILYTDAFKTKYEPQTKIFQPSILKTKKGKYKGYPFRTYSGNKYQGGYSDHFPIYSLIKIKE